MPFVVGKAVDRVEFSRLSSATYVDANGDLRVAAAGALRFQHDPISFAQLGALVEPQRVNKCTNNNYNPTGLVGLALNFTGGSATLAMVDDMTAIRAARLDKVCTAGRAYRLTYSGVTLATLTFAGAAGNTSPHIASAYVRGGAGKIGIAGPQGEEDFIADLAYRRVASESVAPDVSGDQMQISVTGSGVLYVILNQLEQGAETTSVVLVNGAQATRAADLMTVELTGDQQDVVITFSDNVPHTYADQAPGDFVIPTNLGQYLLKRLTALTEAPPPLALIFDPTDDDIVDAQVGEVYPGFTVVASGGSLPYTFTIAEGTLPPGLTLVKTEPTKARVQGTPTASGSFAGIVIQVSDSS